MAQSREQDISTRMEVLTLRERVLRLRKNRHSLHSLHGLDFGIMKDKGTYLWLKPDQSEEFGLGVLTLCDIVVNQHGRNNLLAGQALIAVLTSGFQAPKDLLHAVRKRIDSDHTLIPLKYAGGQFQTTACYADQHGEIVANLNSLHRNNVESEHRQPGAFKQRAKLINSMPVHDHILTSVCTYVFALSIKAVTSPDRAMEHALRLIGHRTGGMRPRELIYPPYEVTDSFCKAVINLIQQCHFLKYTLVLMYLSLHDASEAPWKSNVAHLGRSLEGAGLGIYNQIRDDLVAPGEVPLADLIILRSDMLNYKLATEDAEKLGDFAPFVRFLNMPQAHFFQAGNFQLLIPFMRGYFEVVKPSNNHLHVSESYKNERMRQFGKQWAEKIKARGSTQGLYRTYKHHNQRDEELDSTDSSE
ncbi:uncharacterized protein [Embiotoca jacksoni]|uniref:uncharacterized protein n=1 Tax=Embiotoca jacksoni TaxID=100190 RepID=UPI0037041700